MRFEDIGHSRRRGGVASASTLTAIAGAWIAVSGFVFGEHGAARWTLLATGVLVALIALARAVRWQRLAWPSYLNAAIGGWVFSFIFWVAESGAGEAPRASWPRRPRRSARAGASRAPSRRRDRARAYRVATPARPGPSWLGVAPSAPSCAPPHRRLTR